MLDNVARIRYIQRCLVDSFRNNLGREDVVTSRNGIKLGSGEPLRADSSEAQGKLSWTFNR